MVELKMAIFNFRVAYFQSNIYRISIQGVFNDEYSKNTIWNHQKWAGSLFIHF